MPSLTTAPPWVPLVIKDSLKEDGRPFALVLFLLFLTRKAFGFWLLGEGRLLNVGGFGRERNF
jgi:hypothetical protein